MSFVQATMEWEAQDEGVLAKILAPAGSKDIPVGTPVAVIVDDAEHVRSLSASNIQNPVKKMSAVCRLYLDSVWTILCKLAAQVNSAQYTGRKGYFSQWPEATQLAEIHLMLLDVFIQPVTR